MRHKGQKARVFPTEWLPSLAVETTVPTGKWAKGSPCLAFPIMYTGQEDSHLLRFFSDLFLFSGISQHCCSRRGEHEKIEGGHGQSAMEPRRDDREKEPNCFKNFEITWNYKGYRNARPLVGIVTPNHQL